MEKGIIIGFVGLLIAIQLSGYVTASEGGKYSLEPYETETINLYGNSGDVYEIELVSATTPVDIYIMEFDEYLKVSTEYDHDPDNAKYDFAKKGTTEGKWTWTQPNDESWILLIKNPSTSTTTNIEIHVTNKNTEKAADDLASGIVGSAVCCISVVLIIIVLLVIIAIKMNK